MVYFITGEPGTGKTSFEECRGLQWHLRTIRRSIYISADRNILYSKITKTAGTSICRMALEPNIPDLYPLSGLQGQRVLRTVPYKDLFSFAFVRNPWDRAISTYFMFKDDRSRMMRGMPRDFPGMIEAYAAGKATAGVARHLAPQAPHFLYKGEPFVEFIGRFERLHEDWAHVADRIGLDVELPHANATKHDHYSTYYTQREIDIVRELYAEEIEYLGYEFEYKLPKLDGNS